MNYEKIFGIVSAITTHTRFTDTPAGRACAVGYFANTKKGRIAGVQIHGIEPPSREGSITVAFAAYDGADVDFGDHSAAWPFTVTFNNAARDRDACRVSIDTGTGPGAYTFDVDAHEPERTTATTIVRHVCDAHELGRTKGV